MLKRKAQSPDRKPEGPIGSSRSWCGSGGSRSRPCVLIASWALLVVLARRLPAGLLKDLAGVLSACVTTARRLRRDPACLVG